MFTYRHTRGSILQARWWSWCREIGSVPQSRWLPHPHTCRSYRGWSLRTSCCPQSAPLLHTHNLWRSIKGLVTKQMFCFWSFFFLKSLLYLDSVDSRRLDLSPDEHKAAWDTQETRTAPHLPERLRLGFKFKQRCRHGDKRWGSKIYPTSAGGATVWAQSPCLPVTVLLSIQSAPY